MNLEIPVFFAYPSLPESIPETIAQAVRTINQSHVCQVKTWQDCKVGGKFIIDVICREIDVSKIFCADLTRVNPNVMFELGYAIAKQKRVHLVLDTSIEASKKLFDQLRILTTVGYTPYCNSNDIVKGFYREQPWRDLNNSIYAMSIKPAISVRERATLLYLKANHDTEAAIRLNTCVERFKFPVTLNDPRESSVQPLVWYAKKLLAASGVIVHFCGTDREGARLHNLRYAFVAGMAHGFQKSLLILDESDQASPIDYRDILRPYKTPKECEDIASEWLDNVSDEYNRLVQYQDESGKAIGLTVDLKSLRIGEYIAENEEADLERYFVESSAFLDALNGRHTLVVGRKGSGKTANLFAVANRLRNDKRNLVCVVKPVSYELESIIRLLGSYRERDEKGYLVECLWKFLLYTEIAKATVVEMESKRQYIKPDSPEDQLIRLLQRNRSELREEFAIRLEKAVQSLFTISSEESVEKFRFAVSEILHGGVLKELRSILGKVLTNRKRVAVLIDNLDKAWDKRNDLECLTDFLLGLLRVTRDICQEFARKDYWREPVPVTLTIFLRSDIFARLMKIAREPDKISHSRLLWDDHETLLRVIDERLKVCRDERETPESIWTSMFCSHVHNIPVRDYLVRHVLPRPRDMVFFVSAAIATAVNRGYTRVEEQDILTAEKQYSQFVFESIQVENGISVPELEAILYEFAGQHAILTENEVHALVARTGMEKKRWEYAVRHLCILSFLGVETSSEVFKFCSEEEEMQKCEVIARKVAAARGESMRYKINEPFHAFLEVQFA